MTANRQPTGDELNGKNQDVVQWPAKAYRSTLVDSDGNEITESSGLPVSIANPTDIQGLGKTTVGTTPVELVFSDTTSSIIISSFVDNDGLIYIGKSDVLSDGSNAIAFLDVGESLTMDYNDVDNALYVVSDTAAQVVVVGVSK